jgi:hypothetical protein
MGETVRSRVSGTGGECGRRLARLSLPWPGVMAQSVNRWALASISSTWALMSSGRSSTGV